MILKYYLKIDWSNRERGQIERCGIAMINLLLADYGLPWTINRSLYSIKLKMMMALSTTEKLFEKKVDAKRVDIKPHDPIKLAESILFLYTSIDEKCKKYAENILCEVTIC